MDATPEELGELEVEDPERELERALEPFAAPAGRPWLFWVGVALVAGTAAAAWYYSRRLAGPVGGDGAEGVPVELGRPRLRVRRPGAPETNGAPVPDPASWDGAVTGAWGLAFGGPQTLDAVAEQNRLAARRETELESAGRDLEELYPELGDAVGGEPGSLDS